MTVQEYDRFFRKASHKNLTLTFSDGTVLTNSQMVSESLTLEESLCSDSELRYGACEASCLTIRIAYTEKSFEGLHLQIGVVADGDDTLIVDDSGDYFATDGGDYFSNPEIQSFSFGNYIVYSDVPTNDRQYRDLTCYDKMFEIADLDIATWYSGLTFPMTVKALRDSLFNYLNVEQEPTTLVNDNYQMVGGFNADELVCRDMLVSICELNGVFGHINKQSGKFEYIDLTNSESLTYPYYVNGSGAYQDYVTDKITGIASKSAEELVPTKVGTDTNLYTIIGNLCLYGDEGNQTTVTALTNLLNKIKDTQYRPFTVQTYGNPMLPLGTQVTFETTYQTVESIVITRYLSGIQAMKDTLTASGSKTYPSEEARITSQIKRTKGTTHELVAEVNELKSVIYDADTGIISTISQLSNEVLLKVDANGKIVEVALSADPSTGTEFKVKADNIDFIANDVITLSAKNIGIQATNFSIDKSTGLMNCTGGTIGGFTIDTSKIYNGVTSMSDTSHDGVYVGTDGICLGKGKFKVTSAGALTATSATITGAITTTSLNVDSLAAMSVADRRISKTSYYWPSGGGSMGGITLMQDQKQLQIDTSDRGLYINGTVEVGEDIKGKDLYITGGSNFTGNMFVYGTGNFNENITISKDIIRIGEWSLGGTRHITSLNSALKSLSDRITALGG